MQRIRLTYSKEDNLKFISHLELIRAIEKAIRRSGIRAAFSQGYNPHIKIDFGIPLQMGVTSICELLDIYIEGETNGKEVIEKLNGTLPPGIKIIKAEELALNGTSIQSAVKASVYRIELIKEQLKAEQFIKNIIGSKEIEITRKTKSGEKKIDIRPLILDIKVNKDAVEAILKSSEKETLKVNEFIALFGDIEFNKIQRIRFVY